MEQKIIDLLKSEIDKEVQSLNHFITQDAQARASQPLQLNQAVNS